MNVPYGWLKEYCDPGLPVEELAERLTMAGVKVEAIHRTGVGDPASFVVGKVLSAEQHPDADRLKVCSVDAGEGEPRQIVCGAPNVEAGQTVGVALPGAVMPDGQALGEAKLRGVVSSGMILAEDEVGIGEDHAGTMVLPDDLAAGAPLADHLPIADEVIEIEVVPNRPDTMGVYGVAREAHALSEAPLAPDPTDADLPAPETDFPIDIDPEICLRFTARVFEDVKVGPSPLWLKQRLMAAGQRPISNVVDITNYVMLLTGQPLHAFDLDEVRGGRIIVRKATDGERMVTLDGVERSFDSSMALVCDAEGPSGIAGIMGGQISEVSETTTRVLMEAATWVGINISRTSGKLGLRSEASARFEKQLHPELAAAAQRLTARLMTELCGARQVGQTDVYPSPPEPRMVQLRPARIERLLGERVPDDTVRAILGRLGFEVGGDWSVRVPYWRDSDVQREVDLVEEVGRVFGLDKLPSTLPAREKAVGVLTHSQRVRRRAEDALRDRGALEAIAYSFTREAALADLRLGDVPLLRVANPLSEEHRVMRPLLLPGLLDAARHNAAHGRPALTFFESAHVYRMSAPLDAPGPQAGGEETSTPADERHHIGVVSTTHPDFLATKALLEALLRALDVEGWTEPGERPFLHPGRSASVLAGDESKIGWIGELHPAVAKAWDLGRVAAFELDADALAALSPEVVPFKPFSPYPAVVQDIAVVVDEDVPYAEVGGLVREGGGELLESVELFDLYRGEQAGEGRKSLALRLSFRAPDRTLTDEDVATLRKAIEERLAEVGGRLRAG